MNTAAKLFANVFGVVYVAVGLIGFALTGFDGFAASDGPTLLFFEINPLHNLVHLFIGGLLLAGAAMSHRLAGRTAALVGAVYAIVGVAGIFLIGTAANILALNAADNLLHLATAGVAFAALAAGRAAQPRHA